MIGNRVTFCFYEFYPSNIPYCHLLEYLVDYALNDGRKVEVVTYRKDPESESAMRRRFSSVKFRLIKKPFSSKGLCYVYFALAIFFVLLRYGRGNIVIPTTPPIVMGLAASVAKLLTFSRFRMIYHVQDIHPEITQLANKQKKKLLMHLLKSLDTFTLLVADRVVTLSRDMAGALTSRNKKIENKIQIVNNFYTGDLSGASAESTKNVTQHDSARDSVTFVYAGNVGRYQNIDKLVRYFCYPFDFRAKLIVVGDGECLQRAKEVAAKYDKEKRISFTGRVSQSEAHQIIQKADYGVVSLLPGLLRYAYPSKAISYLSNGTPLFVFADEDTDLGETIIEKNLGIITNTDDSAEFSSVVNEACRVSVKYDRNNIRSIGRSIFGARESIRKFYLSLE